MGEALLSAPSSEADLFYEAGVAAHGAGDLGRAERLYDLAIAAEPRHASALHNLAILRAGLERIAEAIELLQRAIAADPTTPEAHFNLGTILLGEGETAAAIDAFQAALGLRPDYPEALVNLGRALAIQGDPEAALARYLEAEVLAPTYAPALTNIGVALMARGAYLEAGQRFAQVLALDTASPEANYNVANALRALGRGEEALVYFDKALALNPVYVEALVNRANALRLLDRMDEAVETYRRAIALDPDIAKLHLNLGQILRDRGDAEAARAELRTALSLDHEDADACLAALMAELPLVYADEAEVDACRRRYAEGLQAATGYFAAPARRAALARAVGASQPFYLAYQGLDDRALQAAYGALICDAVASTESPAELAPPPAPGERLRVGIVSGCFRNHSNWKIPIRGWLSQLDRSRFEVFAYYTGSRRDAATAEAQALADRFVQGPLTVEAWRREMSADRPHVLIYPEVGMDPVVPNLAARRLAPVQCVSWGHPDTTGFSTLDYFLSSDAMEPEGADAVYTESLVRLPGLGVWWAPEAERSPRTERVALGLRAGATVFWCGQSLPKYLPRYDQVWPRIAKGLSDCQFVFIGLPSASAADALFRTRLKIAFAEEGLDADRHCVILPRLAADDFRAAMGAADIFLDSLGWSGCNTTLESLVHDLPIVTWPGPFLRGRHSAAILTLMGVQETIAPDVDTYVEIAVRLAKDPAWRAEIRAKLAAAKGRLARDPAPVRALETFLEQAVGRA